jgi:hypothetical protein
VLRFQSKLLPSTYLFSLLCSFAAVSGTLVCQANPAGATPAAQHENTPSAGAEPLNDNSLVIKNDSALPATYPHSTHRAEAPFCIGVSRVAFYRPDSNLRTTECFMASPLAPANIVLPSP